MGALVELRQMRRSKLSLICATSLPDAIHAATAILNVCQTFLTNHKPLEALSGIDVVVLSKFLSA